MVNIPSLREYLPGSIPGRQRLANLASADRERGEMRTTEDIYRFHCENLRQVSLGMGRVERSTRRAVAQNDEPTVHALTRLYALLLGTWSECRLKKLLYEKGGFSDDERTTIRSIAHQHGRWIRAVEIAFRKRFKVPNAVLTPPAIPFTAAARYTECQRLLRDDLRPVIELRNKFAHGQWVYLLNNEEDDISTAQMASFKKENFMTLQFKRDLINHLASVINDLVISMAFDRDFDAHYRFIADARTRLETHDYNSYATRLRARHARGKSLRTHQGASSANSTSHQNQC
jgi:hypothetical protein